MSLIRSRSISVRPGAAWARTLRTGTLPVRYCIPRREEPQCLYPNVWTNIPSCEAEYRWAGNSYWGREKTKIIGTALSASGWCYVHAIDLSVDVLTRLGLWASTAFYWKVARQYKDRQRRLRTKSSTKTTLAYSSSCLKQLRPYLMGIARSNVLGKLGRRIC